MPTLEELRYRRQTLFTGLLKAQEPSPDAAHPVRRQAHWPSSCVHATARQRFWRHCGVNRRQAHHRYDVSCAADATIHASSLWKMSLCAPDGGSPLMTTSEESMLRIAPLAKG
jgi:hypothetical protein